MRVLSERVRSILPPDAALTWEIIAPVVPSTAYLGGGTAMAVHLAHRVSRDLDFFFHRNSVNLEELTTKLSAAGPFAVTERAPGTLNGVFSATRVQFLHADEALSSLRASSGHGPPAAIGCGSADRGSHTMPNPTSHQTQEPPFESLPAAPGI